MKQFLMSLSCSALLACSGIAQAIESLAFEVLETHDDIEIRQYAPHLLATVRIEGKFDEAGSQAFRPLFNYISGDNRSDEKIAMTAPVLQQPDEDQGTWLISFVMPSSFDKDSLPVPSSEVVRVSEQPTLRMAALEYRGGWSQARYSEHELQLRSALGAMSLTACGDPRWARHDPPFMPWFMRKNEILVPLCEPAAAR